jgi:hypothetical protein|uniref:Uncharacterized protein n=1 Tax=Zea mays TaxID=4577 RepID=B7ZZA4_MAIZE|nr:unknown [Zea mays]
MLESVHQTFFLAIQMNISYYYHYIIHIFLTTNYTNCYQEIQKIK